MKLRDKKELANSQRKLAELEQLIQKREHSSDPSPAHGLSLETMRHFASKLRAQIEEYQRSHQTA
jgi:hypothetical protein